MERKVRQKLYFLVTVAFYFLALSMVLTGAVLPEWLNRFGISPSKGGQLFSLYYFSYVLVTFSSGVLSDLVGAKWVLVLSQLFLLMGFSTVSLADHFSTIKWGMLLLGFGGGFCEAPLTGLVSRVFTGEEGYALNVSQISFGLGAASGPFLMGFFLSRGISWRVLYLVSGLVSFLLLLLFVMDRALLAVPRTEKEKKDWLSLLNFRGLLLSSFLAIFLYVGAEIGSSAWMSTYLVRELKAGIYAGGVAMAIFWGTITVGRLIFAQLSRLFAPSQLLRLAVGISLAFLVLLNSTRQVSLVFLALGGVGLGYSAIWPFIVANVASKVEHLQATAIGFTVAFGGIGALFFPWLMGVWIDFLSLRSIFLLVLILVVALFIVVRGDNFREERGQ
ncbi:MAG: MFS transporter [Atribacterota bacterium]|nr:MFS transporter [Atribacterota bacterium]